MIDVIRPLFPLGQVVATPAALQALAAAGEDAQHLLERHSRGDWGDLDKSDAALNDEALEDGSRIFSSYRLANGEKLWVITEATDDSGRRSATTILLPDDY